MLQWQTLFYFLQYKELEKTTLFLSEKFKIFSKISFKLSKVGTELAYYFKPERGHDRTSGQEEFYGHL